METRALAERCISPAVLQWLTSGTVPQHIAQFVQRSAVKLTKFVLFG